jgi:protein tyrosine phosphatase
MILFGLQGRSEVSVFGVVRKLREHRFGAIQNSEQYKFIYEYLKYM